MIERSAARVGGAKAPFIPAARGVPADWMTRDGRNAAIVKSGAQGVRDLYAAWIKLAQWVSKDRSRQAYLVALGPRISPGRLEREWRATESLLRPEIARRIGLVVAGPGGRPEIRKPFWVKSLVETLLTQAPSPRTPASVAPLPPSAGFFEVFKVLLHHWLLREGPVKIETLKQECGCSYPTAARTLMRLTLAGELVRESNRSVRLGSFPMKTWGEILALSPGLRRPIRYVDASGRRPDPLALLRRLEAIAPPGVALGGVQAARIWDPAFDLRGLPRLDVTVHASGGGPDLGFVPRLDPALRQARNPGEEEVLVVHPLFRRENLFKKHGGKRVPWVDPVETLLDLHEMGLIEQAEDLVRRLTLRGRP